MGYFAHPTAIVDEGSQIGEGTKIWHFTHVLPNCKIGERCSMGQNVHVGEGVVMGNNVKIQNNCMVVSGVTLEDDVFVGPNCVFTNVTNPRSLHSRKGNFEKTHVGKGASTGANSAIVCGNNIGKFALVGAGSVVMEDVAPYSLVIGNPAKHAGWISEYGHRLNFDENGIAECPESKERYKLENRNVSKI